MIYTQTYIQIIYLHHGGIIKKDYKLKTKTIQSSFEKYNWKQIIKIKHNHSYLC